MPDNSFTIGGNMAGKGKLPKFTLEKNERKGQWDLTKDKTDKTVKVIRYQGRSYEGWSSGKGSRQGWWVREDSEGEWPFSRGTDLPAIERPEKLKRLNHTQSGKLAPAKVQALA
jgi:hypothetical protein